MILSILLSVCVKPGRPIRCGRDAAAGGCTCSPANAISLARAPPLTEPVIRLQQKKHPPKRMLVAAPCADVERHDELGCGAQNGSAAARCEPAAAGWERNRGAWPRWASAAARRELAAAGQGRQPGRVAEVAYRPRPHSLLAA
uniref:Uncharacterized protein n=1 Tax=Paenibacillus athensensis TaxID=1967502 RepID=A0A4Y8Q7D9_9BACL